MLKKITRNWVIYFILGLALLQVMVFTLWGEHSFIAIHDNLDLFVAHNKRGKTNQQFQEITYHISCIWLKQHI